MITQVAFKTDAALKKTALQKAKQEGLTLKAVLTYCMRSYIQGEIGIGIIHRDAEGFTQSARDSLLETVNDPKNTITGSFRTKNSLLDHLSTISK